MRSSAIFAKFVQRKSYLQYCLSKSVLVIINFFDQTKQLNCKFLHIIVQKPSLYSTNCCTNKLLIYSNQTPPCWLECSDFEFFWEMAKNNADMDVTWVKMENVHFSMTFLSITFSAWIILLLFQQFWNHHIFKNNVFWAYLHFKETVAWNGFLVY